jgi:hypothetical protein
VVRETVRIVEKRVEKHMFFVNFVPLGAPQFQNGQKSKGWAIFGIETSLLALNIASYWAAKSYADQGGYFPTESDRTSARAWSAVQITSISLLGAMIVYGVVDGIVNYKSESIVPALSGPQPGN